MTNTLTYFDKESITAEKSFVVEAFGRCHDTQHNDSQHEDTQHEDTQHEDTQHEDTQHEDTQHNNKKCDTLNNTHGTNYFYGECRLCCVTKIAHNPECHSKCRCAQCCGTLWQSNSQKTFKL